MLDYPSRVIFQEGWTVDSLTDICQVNQLLNCLQLYERDLEGVEVKQDAPDHGYRDESFSYWQDTAGNLTGINEEILETNSEGEDDELKNN